MTLCERTLSLPEVVAASTVACYLSTPSEPGTGPLVSALKARGSTVLLPVITPDVLDWAPYRPDALAAGPLGISEPVGERLGPDALSAADVVICPGLAADRQGNRLGRGRGYYDKALALLAPPTLRVILLYDDEIVDVVPTEPHDVPMDVVVTPGRTLRRRPT